MSDAVAIKVNNVSKTFRLPHEKNTSIKGAVVNFYKRNKSYEVQQALNDISFEVKKGEFFGIVGRNGSGKSTLLKMLAGIYTPSKGNIEVNGKLTPFIELGVGFSPELTGRENVFLNGALLGFSRKEMEELYDDIVEFAEIERFMDQKLKNYSSGMQVRLAFSIAIRAKTDILLIDEVLAVGDSSFQKKCYEHFVSLKKQKKTVVLVTHDMGAVERFCDKAMVIHDSEMKGIFSPRDAAVFYEKINLDKATANKSEGSEHDTEKNRWGTKKVEVAEITTDGSHNESDETPVFQQGGTATISLSLKSKAAKPHDVVIGLAIYDQFGVNIAGPNSKGFNFIGTGKITYEFSNISLNPGKYSVTAVVFDKDTIEEYDHLEKAITFEVTAEDHGLHGKINLFGEWSQNED